MKVFRMLIYILIKSSLGIGAIYFTNIILKNWNITVGVNPINGVIIGVLGISGYILLYFLVLIDIFIFT